jgi:hypothetical protein
MLALLLAAIVEEATAPSPTPVAPPHVYLHPPGGCDSRASPDEVVVCANKDADKQYRLQPVDGSRYADKPMRAQMKIGGGTAGVEASQAGVGGWPSNRIMLTLKFPF